MRSAGAAAVLLLALAPAARAQSTSNAAIDWNAIAAPPPRANPHTCSRSAWRWCRRCLRRCQRDRRRPPTLYRGARGRSVGFQAGGRGDRRLPDARRHFPDATGDAPAPLCRIARGRADGPAKTGGVEVGEASAATMLADARERWAGRTVYVVFGTDPGAWRPTPPNFGSRPGPWSATCARSWSRAQRCCARRPERAHERGLRGGPQRGQAARLTHEHAPHRGSDTGRDLLAGQRPAIWNRVFRALAASRGLDIADSARMLAMTNLAAADGSIGCWKDKYYWNFWRPITAIREAGADGNPATTADPTWLPLFDPSVPVSGPALVTPGFPDHPSGHTCISGATVHALNAFFGTDKVPFTAQEQQVLSRALPAPQLRPLLPGAQGDHRRSHLERDPLPHRRRAGGGAGQEGRPPAEEALLPAARLTCTPRAAAVMPPPSNPEGEGEP